MANDVTVEDIYEEASPVADGRLSLDRDDGTIYSNAVELDLADPGPTVADSASIASSTAASGADDDAKRDDDVTASADATKDEPIDAWNDKLMSQLRRAQPKRDEVDKRKKKSNRKSIGDRLSGSLSRFFGKLTSNRLSLPAFEQVQCDIPDQTTANTDCDQQVDQPDDDDEMWSDTEFDLPDDVYANFGDISNGSCRSADSPQPAPPTNDVAMETTSTRFDVIVAKRPDDGVVVDATTKPETMIDVRSSGDVIKRRHHATPTTTIPTNNNGGKRKSAARPLSSIGQALAQLVAGGTLRRQSSEDVLTSRVAPETPTGSDRVPDVQISHVAKPSKTPGSDDVTDDVRISEMTWNAVGAEKCNGNFVQNGRKPLNGVKCQKPAVLAKKPKPGAFVAVLPPMSTGGRSVPQPPRIDGEPSNNFDRPVLPERGFSYSTATLPSRRKQPISLPLTASTTDDIPIPTEKAPMAPPPPLPIGRKISADTDSIQLKQRLANEVAESLKSNDRRIFRDVPDIDKSPVEDDAEECDEDGYEAVDKIQSCLKHPLPPPPPNNEAGAPELVARRNARNSLDTRPPASSSPAAVTKSSVTFRPALPLPTEPSSSSSSPSSSTTQRPSLPLPTPPVKPAAVPPSSGASRPLIPPPAPPVQPSSAGKPLPSGRPQPPTPLRPVPAAHPSPSVRASLPVSLQQTANGRPPVKPRTSANTVSPIQVAQSNGPQASSDQVQTSGDPLEKYDWYVGLVDRKDCELKIKAIAQDGCFVVRRSQRGGETPYALTLLYQDVAYNLQIRRKDTDKYALGSEKPDENVFGSVVELVSFFRNNAIQLTTDRTASNVIAKVHLTVSPA